MKKKTVKKAVKAAVKPRMEKVKSAVKPKVAKAKAQAMETVTDLESFKAAITKKLDLHPSEWDYKQIAINAMKIAVPLVAMKLIHGKYKQSNTKTAKLQKYFNNLFEEAKNKVKEI